MSFSSASGTLVADTVATESFTQRCADFVVVHMVSGSDPIYFTLDGSTPSVEGANCLVVFAGTPSRSVQIPTADAQEVKLISAGTPDYTVEVF